MGKSVKENTLTLRPQISPKVITDHKEKNNTVTVKEFVRYPLVKYLWLTQPVAVHINISEPPYQEMCIAFAEFYPLKWISSFQLW